MDDGSLIPESDESQEPVGDLGRIVEELQPVLGQIEGALEPLGGGITNRNYTASFGGTQHVIRVPGKDTGLLEIDRSAERIANERAARIGIAPPVAAALDDPQAIVTLFVEGEGMEASDLREPQVLTGVARSLRAMHELGEPLPTTFDPFRIVETYAETAAERGAPAPAEEFRNALAEASRIRAALTGPEHDPVPCHNDLLAANFIRGARQLWIVDWEYAGMGDRYFDLANFAVNNELDRAGEVALLTDYFGEDASARRIATLRLMGFMSDFREAMWGVVQASVSDLDFDFDAYAMRHFERMHQRATHPGYETWLEQAREPAD
jgi:thiamine kinase-like enzyme